MTWLVANTPVSVITRCWVCAVALLLASCGFELKGSGNADMALDGLTIRLISNQPRAEPVSYTHLTLPTTHCV